MAMKINFKRLVLFDDLIKKYAIVQSLWNILKWDSSSFLHIFIFVLRQFQQIEMVNRIEK